MTREIEWLLNNHDNTFAQTLTNWESILDAKAYVMTRKLDEVLNSSNQESRSSPKENSHQTTDGFRAPRHSQAPPRSRSSFESNQRERPRVAPSKVGWTDPFPPVPHVRSVPDFTTVWHDSTMQASKIETLNKFVNKLSKSAERGERSGRTLKKPKSYKDESNGCNNTRREVMRLHFEEENLSMKQDCIALTVN